ncbi:MAG TPA: ABC transporter ATP-binding protein [Acidimicrobiales bacterium]|nr:ABC transporter ATP-binding protein [Acidimicrobiales bacterium]
MSSVEVRELSVRAGAKELISNVTLAFEPGTWSTVIGPNGAGKTTLVETIAGLRQPSHGSVSILGHSLATMNERERALRVALVPQHPVVPSGMSVYDYVALGRVAHHGLFHPPSVGDRKIVESVLERLSLVGFRDRDGATLSGGERQRMVLARALTQSTMVVVLDEPITGLDLRHQMDMLELMKHEVHECGLTVVATLHDLTLAGQFADRLVLLDLGEVVLDGTAAVVIRSDELAKRYGMNLRVVDVDGSDVVVPVRHEST